jgi:hypothetical protein
MESPQAKLQFFDDEISRLEALSLFTLSASLLGLELEIVTVAPMARQASAIPKPIFDVPSTTTMFRPRRYVVYLLWLKVISMLADFLPRPQHEVRAFGKLPLFVLAKHISISVKERTEISAN